MTDRRDPSPHNQLVRFWCDEFLRQRGAKYPFHGGKDAAAIKWLLSIYTEDEIRTFMAAFFEMDDPFFVEGGHSLGIFRSCLPKVIAYVQKPQRERRVMSDAAATVFRVIGGGK